MSVPRIGKTVGSVQRGIAAIARMMGKTVGVFGRIRRRLTRERQKKPERLAKPRKTELHALELEIEGIETELHQIYGRVVEGAGAVGRYGTQAGAEAPKLEALLEAARDRKEKLREKRAEMSRLRRDAAREKRLKWNVSPQASSLAETTRPTARPRERKTGIEGRALGAKMRKAMLKAAQDARFSDPSQQTLFDATVQELVQDDADMRRAAASRLGGLRHPAVLKVLALAAEDPDQEVCAAALNSLALLGAPALKQLFVRFSASPDHHLRLASLRGLAKVGGDEASRALLAGLDDENPAVRKSAATYLGWSREKAATRRLMQALRDEDEAVKCAAAESLGVIRDDKAVLPLIRALSESSGVLRHTAKTALEALLGEKLAIDIVDQPEPYDPEIEELKEWWKTARIDRQAGAETRLPDFLRADASGKAAAAEAAGANDQLRPVSTDVAGVDETAPSAAMSAQAGGLLQRKREAFAAARAQRDRMRAEPAMAQPSGSGEPPGMQTGPATVPSEAAEELAGLGLVASVKSEAESDRPPEAPSGTEEFGADGEDEGGETGLLGLDDLDIQIGRSDSGLNAPGASEADATGDESLAEKAQEGNAES